MIFRSLKWGVATAAGAVLVGGLVFGRDLVSYVSCGVSNVQDEIRAAIPIDVELERARHMITKITPELRSNVRLIAHEEVAVQGLRKEIKLAMANVSKHRQQVAMLRDRLGETQTVSISVGDRTVSRSSVVEKLSSRLSRFKQASAELDSKQKMLQVRERSLAAAQEMYERSRARKAELEQTVESLAAKHRLVKARSIATSVHFDDSQLARADRLMKDIEKRLQVAERVMSYEADLESPEFDEMVDETALLEDADACLGECEDFDHLMTDEDVEQIVRISTNES